MAVARASLICQNCSARKAMSQARPSSMADTAQIPVKGVQACLFDAYGTLFDFASAARACPEIPRDAVDKFTTLWRDKQLQYTWLRAAQDRHADFWQEATAALEFTLQTLAVETAGLRHRPMRVYLKLRAVPEVPPVL